ncbi:MAG: heme biosynthesis protein HemY [Proteobacteria bacterium]|nr:heme biosynthesis protein HemY [Pseudomonadota bacterium]
MIRLFIYFLGVVALAAGLSWLADRPGSLVIAWQGWDIETSVFSAVVIAALAIGSAIFLYLLVRQILRSPALLGRYVVRRRHARGLDALSNGLIAIGAGDAPLALRSAMAARQALPNEPLTHLLRAQAAQLTGDRATSRRIFEAMLAQPDTEQLGLRGLYLEAEREGETEAQRQFAERALRINPRLGWPVEALLAMQTKDGNWEAALETVAAAKKSAAFDKATADRYRAILLTARAQEIEEANGAKASEMAIEAHGLAPDLIPAAAIAGRQLASRGATPKAAKIIERTWKLAPHPELALVYSFARPGDSPRDRLERIKRLARIVPQSVEGPIAIATAAIEAKDWVEARLALRPLVDGYMSARVATMMARVEREEKGDAGRVREWLARAVTAPRDPAWVVDGVVSDRWVPVSPVTGALGACEWKVPPEGKSEARATTTLTREQLEQLLLLDGASSVSAPAAKPGAGEVRERDPAVVDVEAVAAPTKLNPAGTAIEPLRPRQPDSSRPITVEVEPVDEAKPFVPKAPPIAMPRPRPTSGNTSKVDAKV